jgi:hypothetical protein
MRLLRRSSLILFLCLAIIPTGAQPASTIRSIRMYGYSVEITPGEPPRLTVARDGEAVFDLPVVSGLASDEKQEQLSHVEFTTREGDDGTYQLSATAQSSLWSGRRFQWRFFPDRIEFQQFATGHGRLGRNYFVSNGVSNRWDNGSTGGRAWTTTVYADRYFSPSPRMGFDGSDEFEVSYGLRPSRFAPLSPRHRPCLPPERPSRARSQS